MARRDALRKAVVRRWDHENAGSFACDDRLAAGKRKLNLRLLTNGRGTCSEPPGNFSFSWRSLARTEAAADSILRKLLISDLRSCDPPWEG